MTLQNMMSLLRVKIPEAGKAAQANAPITDENLIILLNLGVLDIVRYTLCLPTYKSFDTVANQAEYNLTTLVSDFLIPLEFHPVYYYDESAYEELDIVTRGYLDEKYSGWMTDSADTPELAFFMGDKLTVHPKPETAITDGIKLYYSKKPNPMDETTNIYPFGGALVMPSLTPYHMVVVEYAEWQIWEALGRDKRNAAALAFKKYTLSKEKMKAELMEYDNNILIRSSEAGLRMDGGCSESPF